MSEYPPALQPTNQLIQYKVCNLNQAIQLIHIIRNFLVLLLSKINNDGYGEFLEWKGTGIYFAEKICI